MESKLFGVVLGDLKDAVLAVVDRVYENKLKLVEAEYTFRIAEAERKKIYSPGKKTQDKRYIENEARLYEKHYKAVAGLDKRTSHTPSYYVAFNIVAGDDEYEDTSIQSAYIFHNQAIGSQSTSLNYKIYNVFKQVVKEEHAANLDKVMLPHIGKVLKEKEKWANWQIVEKLPLIASWRERDPDPFDSVKLARLNSAVKEFYKTTFLRCHSEADKQVGSAPTAHALARLVALLVYEESKARFTHHNSMCYELAQNNSHDLLKEQLLFEKSNVLPVLYVQDNYGLFEDE